MAAISKCMFSLYFIFFLIESYKCRRFLLNFLLLSLLTEFTTYCRRCTNRVMLSLILVVFVFCWHARLFCFCFFLLSKISKFHHRNDTREVIVQTGVIGICGRWPLAAPLLIVSRLPLMGGRGECHAYGTVK
jgi:hypothetical protein